MSVSPAASTGLFSTVDDFLAFGRMMLNFGRHGAQRILARPTVEVMTADHITPEQKATSPFFPGFWDKNGWGFGISVVTARDGIGPTPGAYGWAGGFGTSWWCDPHEDLVGLLMIQRLGNPADSRLHQDFSTLAYAAIDD